MCPPHNPEAAGQLTALEVSATWQGHDKAVLLISFLPAMARLKSQRILELVSAGDDGVFIQYGYELTNGERYRNTEFVAVHNGQPIEDPAVLRGPHIEALPSILHLDAWNIDAGAGAARPVGTYISASLSQAPCSSQSPPCVS